MFHLIMWITGVIFVIVEGALLLFLFKYRRRPGREVHYTHGNNRLEVVWTIIPALICVMLALLSRRPWAGHQGSTCPTARSQIRRDGRAVRVEHPYPGPDGKFGTPDDIATLNQLHFPVGKRRRRDPHRRRTSSTRSSCPSSASSRTPFPA